MSLTRRQAEILLDDLCQRLGFCLPPSEYAALRDQPPSDARAFADAVFRAEGLDPLTADSDLYREVKDRVDQAFSTGDDDVRAVGMRRSRR